MTADRDPRNAHERARRKKNVELPRDTAAGYIIRRCSEIKYSGIFPELRHESFSAVVHAHVAMGIVRTLLKHDEEPAEKVIRTFVDRTGMNDRTPAELIGQLDQWLRMISRYVEGQGVLTPHDTDQAWGAPVTAEEAFVDVAHIVTILAHALEQEYKKRFSGEQVSALMAASAASAPKPERGDGLGWDWNDDEDMVARIAGAPPLRPLEDRPTPQATQEQRAHLRAHFMWGHDLTEIADHSNIASEIVLSEHMTWRNEQMVLGGLIDKEGNEL